MSERNAAFFSLYENLFIILKEEIGEEKALSLFRKIMERGLKAAYDAAGFDKGRAESFVRAVKGRDERVGLHVELRILSENRIVYRFHDDPFPGLKGSVDPHRLDDTYMSFKVGYLLGKGWGYKTTKHLWKNDSCTEFEITKK